jgi:hypothetical protein
MTITARTTTETATHHSSLRYAARDVVTLARRNLLALIRVPTALVFMVIQPVMFVLLFRYIFQALGAFTHGNYVNSSRGSWCRRRSSAPSAPPLDWPKTCSAD